MPEPDFNILPNFLLIGAAKAGTTSLHNLLNQHPEVFCSKIKEPNFFSSDERFAFGLDWYQRKYFYLAQKYPARGESSATTLYWGNRSAPRIKAVYGDHRLKFIAIFRDPIQRAYSHYWQQIRNGYETLSFEEALSLEDERLQEHTGEMQKKGKVHFGYFRGGCYATLLQPFLEQFPRKDFAFIVLDDLKQNFSQTMASLENFLGVQSGFQFLPIQSNSSYAYRIQELDRIMRQPSGKVSHWLGSFSQFLPDLRRKLKRGIRKANSRSHTYPPMDPGTARLLRERYLTEIERLEEILMRPIEPWKIS